MSDQHTETKSALCRILNLDPNVSDKHLIDVVQRCADAAGRGEAESAKRAVAEDHEKEVQKILNQAGGALRRDQAEQVLRDRAASSASARK